MICAYTNRVCSRVEELGRTRKETKERVYGLVGVNHQSRT